MKYGPFFSEKTSCSKTYCYRFYCQLLIECNVIDDLLLVIRSRKYLRVRSGGHPVILGFLGCAVSIAR